MTRHVRLHVRAIFTQATLGMGLLGLALASPALAQAAPDAATQPADPAVHKVAQAGTDFGLRLLKRLAPEPGHANVFFSPFSVSQALSLALNGAGGNTHQGIAGTLGLGAMPTAVVNQGNERLLPSLETADPQVELTVANALWLQTGESFRPAFSQACHHYYGADTMTLNLRGPEGAPAINGWVSKQTRGKISQIVTRSALRGATAVLTNAVYFHGQWTTPFNKAATQPAPFTLASGSQKTVPLMTRTGRMSYLKGDGFQAVRLPYGQGRLAMYVFLPDAPSGLDALLQTATPARWDGWLTGMTSKDVTLFLPRFHADDTRQLKAPLSQMGMASAFGPGADFRPMGLSRSAISEVIHKATLDVDEEGTVATAATGVGMHSLAMRRIDPVVVRVDHPFLCAIRDDATGTVLFLGAIREP